MALVFKKCPHCRTLLPDTNAGIYIESPFRNCDNCGKLFVDSERNEWDCASIFLKMGFIFRYSISSFAYALIPAGLAYWGQQYLAEPILSEAGVIVLYLALVGAGLFYFGGQLQADIAKSKMRTQNAEYREVLKRAGFKLK
jgi:hypothetical protein